MITSPEFFIVSIVQLRKAYSDHCNMSKFISLQ